MVWFGLSADLASHPFKDRPDTRDSKTPIALELSGSIFGIIEGHTQLSPVLCCHSGSDVRDHGHPGKPCEELWLPAQVPPGGRQRCGERRDPGQPSRRICWVSICLQQRWVSQHFPHILTQNASNASFSPNNLRSRPSLTVSHSVNTGINRFTKKHGQYYFCLYVESFCGCRIVVSVTYSRRKCIWLISLLFCLSLGGLCNVHICPMGLLYKSCSFSAQWLHNVSGSPIIVLNL